MAALAKRQPNPIDRPSERLEQVFHQGVHLTKNMSFTETVADAISTQWSGQLIKAWNACGWMDQQRRVGGLSPALSGRLGHDALFAFESDYPLAPNIERMPVDTPPVLQMAALEAAMSARPNMMRFGFTPLYLDADDVRAFRSKIFINMLL